MWFRVSEILFLNSNARESRFNKNHFNVQPFITASGKWNQICLRIQLNFELQIAPPPPGCITAGLGSRASRTTPWYGMWQRRVEVKHRIWGISECSIAGISALLLRSVKIISLNMWNRFAVNNLINFIYMSTSEGIRNVNSNNSNMFSGAFTELLLSAQHRADINQSSLPFHSRELNVYGRQK